MEDTFAEYRAHDGRPQGQDPVVVAPLDLTPDQRILHCDLTDGAAAGAAEFVTELGTRFLPAAGTTEAKR